MHWTQNFPKHMTPTSSGLKRFQKNKPSKSNSFCHTSTGFTLQTSKWCIMEVVWARCAGVWVCAHTWKIEEEKCVWAYLRAQICVWSFWDIYDLLISFRPALRHKNTLFGIIICVSYSFSIYMSFTSLIFYPSSSSKYRIYRQMIKTSQSGSLSVGNTFSFLHPLHPLSFHLCHYVWRDRWA